MTRAERLKIGEAFEQAQEVLGTVAHLQEVQGGLVKALVAYIEADRNGRPASLKEYEAAIAALAEAGVAA
jgi:hypothetical protein